MRGGLRGLRIRRHRDLRQEHLEEGEIGLGPELAGEADGGVGAAPTRLSTNASRWTAPATTLQSPITRMRQVEQRARPPQTLACGTLLRRLASSTLRPFGHPNRPAIAVGQGDHAAPALVQRADAPRQQHKSEQAEIADQEIILDAVQIRPVGWRADLARRKILRPPFGAVAVDDASSALIETEHGQRRNQHRGGEQIRRRAPVERFHPQPEIKTDAAVDPGDDHDREHQPDFVRPHDPVRKKHLRIELFMSEKRMAEPHAGNVGDDERRDAQAEHELERLDRLPAKLPALVKRPDAEAGVDQRRGVKHDRDREKLPERGVVIDAGGKRIDRDIAERMVEEMADQIGKQHQPAGETDLPDADAADEFCQLFPGKGGHAIQSNAHRQRSAIVEFNSTSSERVPLLRPAEHRGMRAASPFGRGLGEGYGLRQAVTPHPALRADVSHGRGETAEPAANTLTPLSESGRKRRDDCRPR